ncbi:metallophosphoesterase family protein [Plantactinospora mayteni]|uniref:metallophosphoesterase family protein n=1 Tax=Plantactinospora mayteni TaxID=566021 RepID=UPI001EF40DBE|nr:metallophosphoesterase [Plantactinospora mayteni]
MGRLAVGQLPTGCDAVLVTGDLQGVTPSPWGGPPVLLGVALGDYLSVWAEQELIPPPARLAVVLAGDLYCAPTADRRGASGEVADVWWALASVGCRLIVGVAGNHDVVASDQLAELGPAAALLDGDWIDHGGVRFAGVGNIVGDPRRPGRRSEQSQLARLGAALTGRPSVLVLHEGPPGEHIDQPGNPVIGAHLREHPPTLTVCGHVHWEAPLARLGAGHVLNVDGRAILLTPQPD